MFCPGFLSVKKYGDGSIAVPLTMMIVESGGKSLTFDPRMTSLKADPVTPAISVRTSFEANPLKGSCTGSSKSTTTPCVD